MRFDLRQEVGITFYLAQLQDLNIQLELMEDRIRVSAPPGVITSEIQQSIARS